MVHFDNVHMGLKYILFVYFEFMSRIYVQDGDES